jgi:hypothetical protein
MNDDQIFPLALALFFIILIAIVVLMLMIPYPPKVVQKTMIELEKPIEFKINHYGEIRDVGGQIRIMVVDTAWLSCAGERDSLRIELAKYKRWYADERNKEWFLREENAKLREEK